MNVLTRTTRRASVRALVGVTTVALAAAAVTAPAASAALTPADAGHTGLYGAAYAGYDGVYRQSVAILGLEAAGYTPATSAVDWLLDQQCANDGFSDFNPTPGSACAPYDGMYSGGTATNATALAVQALYAVGEDDAADDAAAYLRSVQNADGGWGYTAESTGGSDPNSTGLVLTALNAAGLTPIDPDGPTDYLASLQVGRAGVPTQFPGDEGGISSPYSDGFGDAIATPQVVTGLLGDDLVDVTHPSFATWTAGAPVPVNPPATAQGIGDWAASWLVSQAAQGGIFGGYKAWAVLSLASDRTGRTAAQDLYDQIRTEVPTTDPAALAQAALAATALGENADAQRFATLIAATLTPAAGRDSGAAAEYAASNDSVWVGQTVTVTNPYLGTPLPITQTVIWGDGSTSALAGATATHTYALADTYRPTVRVEVTGYDRPAYAGLGVVKVAKPSATLKLSKSAAWLGASVTLTKSGVTGAPTTTTVAWGDGTTSSLTNATSTTHTYKKAGTFTPKVNLTNGTGGTAQLATAPATVKVTKDTGKPTVTLTTPSSRTKVSSWKTVKGTAKDAGIGVKSVTVRLVEKRNGSWYAYNGTTWKKKSTYAKAVSAAKAIKVTPSSKGAWSLKVAKLTKGKLTVKYFATDKAGNASATRTTTGTLTK